MEVSGGKRVSSPTHSTLFIVDNNGNKYKVPQYIFSSHHIGDSFSVTRSFIFSKAIRFQSVKDGYNIHENIGVFNSDWFSRVISVIPLVLCIIVMFFDKSLKNESVQMAFLWFSILLGAVVAAFYFIFST